LWGTLLSTLPKCQYLHSSHRTIASPFAVVIMETAADGWHLRPLHILKVLHSSRKCCKWVLASSLGLPHNGLSCTIVMRLVLISKFPFPVLILGSVGTWSLERAEHSRRVFSWLSIGVNVDGTNEAGSTSICTRCEDQNGF
jgi:hypothetical protein